MASESSANASSNALRGNGASPFPAFLAEPRNDERDEGRKGVVGRGVRERAPERLAFESGSSKGMVWVGLSFQEQMIPRMVCSSGIGTRRIGTTSAEYVIVNYLVF